MEIRLCVKDWETTGYIHVDELVRRLLLYFPIAVIDRDRGNAYVQRTLDELIAKKTPAVILESHRTYFDNVVYAEVSESRWNGVKAMSYLTSMRPQLGDRTHFELSGTSVEREFEEIASELEVALGMVLCSKLQPYSGRNP